MHILHHILDNQSLHEGRLVVILLCLLFSHNQRQAPSMLYAWSYPHDLSDSALDMAHACIFSKMHEPHMCCTQCFEFLSIQISEHVYSLQNELVFAGHPTQRLACCTCRQWARTGATLHSRPPLQRAEPLSASLAWLRRLACQAQQRAFQARPSVTP